MDPGLMCLAMIAAVAMLAGGIAFVVRKHAMSRAMRDSCLICDSERVHVRNRDGEYHCRDCGFDTDLEVFPSTNAAIGQFRDLKNALYSFEQGLKAMKWAQAAAVADAAGGRTGAKYQKMEEASAHMMEGFSLLKDLL